MMILATTTMTSGFLVAFLLLGKLQIHAFAPTRPFGAVRTCRSISSECYGVQNLWKKLLGRRVTNTEGNNEEQGQAIPLEEIPIVTNTAPPISEPVATPLRLEKQVEEGEYSVR